MAIQPYQGSSGPSKALKAGMGFATGGPAGGALALSSSNNPMIGDVAKIGLNTSGSGQDKSAMQRRQEATDPSTNPSHDQILESGFNALHDENIPQDVRDKLVPLFIAAKTHGANGISTDHMDFGFGDTSGATQDTEQA